MLKNPVISLSSMVLVSAQSNDDGMNTNNNWNNTHIAAVSILLFSIVCCCICFCNGITKDDFNNRRDRELQTFYGSTNREINNSMNQEIEQNIPALEMRSYQQIDRLNHSNNNPEVENQSFFCGSLAFLSITAWSILACLSPNQTFTLNQEFRQGFAGIGVAWFGFATCYFSLLLYKKKCVNYNLALKSGIFGLFLSTAGVITFLASPGVISNNVKAPWAPH